MALTAADTTKVVDAFLNTQIKPTWGNGRVRDALAAACDMRETTIAVNGDPMRIDDALATLAERERQVASWAHQLTDKLITQNPNPNPIP